MHSQRTILGLVDYIYAAVEDQTLWSVFLERLASPLRCAATNLFIQDLRQPSGNAFATYNTDASFSRSYAEYYGRINVFILRGQAHLKAGNVSFSDELCPDKEAVRSEFWNDWILPQGHERGLLATIYAQNSLLANAGAIRARGAKPFSPEDKELLQALVPHLQRAVKLRRHIAELELLRQESDLALDRWATGVLLVDRDARVIAANQAAEEILREQDGLFLEKGTLKATAARESAALHKLIRERVVIGVSTGEAQGTMLVERPSGKRALALFVAPCVRNDLFFDAAAAHALVFVSDPENSQPHHEILQQLYGLTPAETNVAALVARGKTVKEIADETEVQENTIRIHLKRIFDKTGTKRQSELLKAILSSPATLRLGPH